VGNSPSLHADTLRRPFAPSLSLPSSPPPITHRLNALAGGVRVGVAGEVLADAQVVRDQYAGGPSVLGVPDLGEEGEGGVENRQGAGTSSL
jgi:hypothetical protein